MNQDTFTLLLHLHSIGRWVVLLLLLFAIFNSLVAGSRPWIRTDLRIGSILTIFADIMFVVGLVLWYFGPRGYKLIESFGMSAVMKNAENRFFCNRAYHDDADSNHPHAYRQSAGTESNSR